MLSPPNLLVIGNMNHLVCAQRAYARKLPAPELHPPGQKFKSGIRASLCTIYPTSPSSLCVILTDLFPQRPSNSHTTTKMKVSTHMFYCKPPPRSTTSHPVVLVTNDDLLPTSLNYLSTTHQIRSQPTAPPRSESLMHLPKALFLGHASGSSSRREPGGSADDGCLATDPPASRRTG